MIESFYQKFKGLKNCAKFTVRMWTRSDTFLNENRKEGEQVLPIIVFGDKVWEE